MVEKRVNLNMYELMPIHIKASRMTDEEFVRFCEDNPELRLERNAEKEILIMSPSFPKTGIIISLINIRIGEWSLKTKSGYVADSSSGFFLKDGSMRSPDVAWIPMTDWLKFSDADKNGFLKYCPAFVIEVKSTSDRLPELQAKMKNWIKNGSVLGWLIDPDKETTWVYNSDGSVVEIKGFDNSLSDEKILPGFTLQLNELRLV